MEKSVKNRKSLLPYTWDRFLRFFLSEYKWMAFFVAFSLLCFLAMAYFGFSLWIFAILIILPLFFAAQVAINHETVGGKASFSLFLSAFASYFSYPYRGVYRACLSLIKSLIGFALAFFLTMVIFLNVDANLSPALNDLYKNFSDSQSGQLWTTIDTTPSLRIALYLSFSISYGVAALVMIRSLLVNSLNFHLRSHLRLSSSRSCNYIFSQTIKDRYVPFISSSYKIGWPVYLLFAGGYVMGSVIFFPYVHSPYALSAGSLAFGLLLASPALLFYILGLRWIWKENEVYFLSSLIDYLKQSLSSAVLDPRVSQEAIRSINKVCDNLERSRENLEKSTPDVDKEDDPFDLEKAFEDSEQDDPRE